MSETINREQIGSAHYQDDAIQPVEYIWRNGLDFFEGNVVKYVTRHRKRSGRQDIIKALDYCVMILEYEYRTAVDIEIAPSAAVPPPIFNQQAAEACTVVEETEEEAESCGSQ